MMAEKPRKDKKKRSRRRKNRRDGESLDIFCKKYINKRFSAASSGSSDSDSDASEKSSSVSRDADIEDVEMAEVCLLNVLKIVLHIG